uniref:Uncharacterized protein n=1 Tax=Trichogramma kaykai TaxID=54128 RepID=A0ABD2WBN3_9HYME
MLVHIFLKQQFTLPIAFFFPGCLFSLESPMNTKTMQQHKDTHLIVNKQLRIALKRGAQKTALPEVLGNMTQNIVQSSV